MIHDMTIRGDDDIELERIREVSKALYGNRYRLEVAAAVAQWEPGVVHARALATELRVPDNVVQGELKHFASAGILVPLGRHPRQRTVDYERMPSPYWSSARELLDSLLQRSIR